VTFGAGFTWGSVRRPMVNILLFPGQGAQKVGMGKDLAEAFPEARDTFRAVDEALGIPLSRTMWEGPRRISSRPTSPSPRSSPTPPPSSRWPGRSWDGRRRRGAQPRRIQRVRLGRRARAGGRGTAGPAARGADEPGGKPAARRDVRGARPGFRRGGPGLCRGVDGG
jgi:hypothetical protein